MEALQDTLPVGSRVVVTDPAFPPMSNRGRTGNVVAVFISLPNLLRYLVEVDGVAYDYAPDEIALASAAFRQAA